MGDKADNILSSLQLAEEKQNDYDEVKQAFDGHRNVIYEQAKFNKRCQEVDKSAENLGKHIGKTDYCKKLGEHCKYGILREEMIRDRIVV